MSKTVLLIRRKGFPVEEIRQQLDLHEIKLLNASSLEEVRKILAVEAVDHVIMGAGLGLELRCDIVREVFTSSDTTTVHLKDLASGPEGMLPFASAVLSGFSD